MFGWARFRKVDAVRSLFDFVDVESAAAGELKPGSYNLVMQYPRQVFGETSPGTLTDAGLVHKQEALLLEPK